MEAIFFYLFGGLAVIASILVVFIRKPVHNAMALIFVLICIAGLFFLLDAEFVAILQVLVYAGAIMVLFLFVIMLLNLDTATPRATVGQWGKRFGVLFGIVVFVILAPVWTMRLLPVKGTFGPEQLQEASNTVWVARMLFREYLLPFEIASILLLAAILGAVYFAVKSGPEDLDRVEEPEAEIESGEPAEDLPVE